MSETDATNYLDTFPAWLRSLGEDAQSLSDVLAHDAVSREAKETIVGGLNYLFKSLDLIPDGIDDLGYLDDAFVLRVAADLASAEGSGDVPEQTRVGMDRLSEQCATVRSFLGDDYSRLERYVRGLREGAARGRSVSDILEEDQVRGDFLSDVRGFARSYEAPSFAREEKNLIKLKAFFDAKLPR